MSGDRASTKTPAVTRPRPSDLDDRCHTPGVDVLTEEAEADGHRHQGLRDGQRGQRQAQRAGVKGALGEQQRCRLPPTNRA